MIESTQYSNDSSFTLVEKFSVEKAICISVVTLIMSSGPTVLVWNTSIICCSPVSTSEPGGFTAALLMSKFRLPFISWLPTTLAASAMLAWLVVSNSVKWLSLTPYVISAVHGRFCVMKTIAAHSIHSVYSLISVRYLDFVFHLNKLNFAQVKRIEQPCQVQYSLA